MDDIIYQIHKFCDIDSRVNMQRVFKWIPFYHPNLTHFQKRLDFYPKKIDYSSNWTLGGMRTWTVEINIRYIINIYDYLNQRIPPSYILQYSDFKDCSIFGCYSREVITNTVIPLSILYHNKVESDNGEHGGQ